MEGPGLRVWEAWGSGGCEVPSQGEPLPPTGRTRPLNRLSFICALETPSAGHILEPAFCLRHNHSMEHALLSSSFVQLAENLSTNAGDTRDSGSIPGLGRSSGLGNGNPLDYPCVGNPMEGGAWRATVHKVAKNRT